MNGALAFNRESGRYAIYVSDRPGHAVNIRELHCGDVFFGRNILDGDDAQWMPIRVELEGDDWWYMIDEAGREFDDFELIEVLVDMA